MIDVYDPDLTFKGLKIIYDKYKKNKMTLQIKCHFIFINYINYLCIKILFNFI